MLKPHFRKYGAGPPLIILHGLFGSSDNWHSLATRWGQTFTVYALDLRNHGASPHDSVMTYQAMADDLYQFLEDNNIPTASIAGHSLGGRVAMLFATLHPDLVENLIVLDIGISGSEGKHGFILEVLEQVHPEEYEQRGDVERAFQIYVEAPAIRQFLLKNVLRRVDGSLAWKFNRDTLLESYTGLTKPMELWEPFLGPTLFLRGEYSDYLRESMDPDMLQFFPMAHLKTIGAAGHWLHAEQPAEIYTQVLEFLIPDLGIEPRF